MKLTHHAVEQFCSRWRPDLDVNAAEEELVELAANAVPTSLRTPKGHHIWRTRNGIRLVLKWDVGRRDPICVTVLGPDGDRDPEEPGDSIEALVNETPTAPASDPFEVASVSVVEEARAELDLASVLYSASRSFLLSAKTRYRQATARLRELQR